MVKVKGTVKAKVRRNGKPIKAGSTSKPHGGFPTGTIIKINAQIKKDNG